MTAGTRRYLACDLGAESGRLMLGTLADGRLTLKELHRFPNGPVQVGGSLHWDIDRLFDELKAGLRAAGARGVPIASISTDSWGLDYVLLDAAGKLIPPTFCYRDPRTARGVKHTLAQADWPTIFAETGIQFMPINTLFQLAAEDPARLAKARTLLGIGDAFNWFLSGEAVAEVSLASTFQLYNPRTNGWSERLIDALELPRRLFPEIVPSGTILGRLTALAEKETMLMDTLVIAGCSHDTGAAVAAVPAVNTSRTTRESRFQSGHAPRTPDWAYISSGTWSLMGVELSEPVLTDACRELNFTNEIGHGHTVRLLKNLIGLWLVQECRRHWAARGDDHDYAALTELAAVAPAFRSLINPADPRFLPPGDMPERIAAYCRETGQPVPETPGAFVRCALESLALLYRRTLLEVQQLTGTNVSTLHIVGGGSQNTLLNQFTANACGVPVIAGPAEATAMGNVLVQALALGHLDSLEAARQIVRTSTRLATFTPQEQPAWDAAFERFRQLH
jgi:rhamnulokinase